METQKTLNLLNSSENEFSKFAARTWYVTDSESKGGYSHHDPIKFLTNSIESNLCDYSDAYIWLQEILLLQELFLLLLLLLLLLLQELILKENNHLMQLHK